MRTTTVIFRSSSREQAHLLRQVLADQGIMATVIDQVYHEGAPAAVQVLVFSDQAAQAHRVVRDFLDEWTSVEPDAVLEEAYTLEEEAGRKQMAWRACSQCGTDRLIKCPACGERRHAFPLADPPPYARASEPEEDDGWPVTLRLECPTCDEIFKPRDAGVCEQCGRPFEHAGAGAAAQAVGDIQPDSPWQVSHLLYILLAALLLGALGVYLYGTPNGVRPPLF
ncbi:MAG: hypothetical protein WD468_13145 [Pirellulales bacterium]